MVPSASQHLVTWQEEGETETHGPYLAHHASHRKVGVPPLKKKDKGGVGGQLEISANVFAVCLMGIQPGLDLWPWEGWKGKGRRERHHG